MIQIRYARNNVPSALVDRLPSYKFYKARYLKSINSHAIVILLAMYKILPFLDSDTEALEYALYSYLDAGVGSNSPFIEKPNQNNFHLYYYGVISRILGLLNSCPSTNHQIFNFPSSVKDASVEDILKLLPFPEISKPSVEEVTNFLRNEMLREDEKPSFEEEALINETGLTALESQLFGDVMSRKIAKTNILSRGSLLPSNAITLDDIKSVLSRIEFAAYELSVKDNPSKLKELTSLAVERLNAHKAAQKEQLASSKSSSTVGSENPNDGIGTASSPSASILLGTAPARKGRPPGSKNKSPKGSPSVSKKSSRASSPSLDAKEPAAKFLTPPLASDSDTQTELQQKKSQSPTLDGTTVPSEQPQQSSSTSQAKSELGKSQTSTQLEVEGGGGVLQESDASTSESLGTDASAKSS
eukprot:CAMPEP_0202364850 /NCGR_PEP_ID=MMETSP1126-20121109/16095_1 /ASSEMBLY_ACC=CAM_ASM_000457 /TAXON_ID=3047 /ORGANISM="Dunaliella tertiolecta, Strain CCMP1320" /LENGTH=414 /DNA_ID=CAMNT_0048959579 /DNA_START=1949 /DNA_END=3193 /DNA_ORIENTATION=+